MLKDRKVRRSLCILCFLLAALILILYVIPTVFSKYESKIEGVAKPQVAYYLLKETYQKTGIELPALYPRTEPYIYTFSISNTDGEHRLETRLQYILRVITTTNLPLSYELFLNNDMLTNIIVNEETLPDEDGTYFKTMNTDAKYFGYEQEETNYYSLYIYFPAQYNDAIYQDIIESIEIEIDSKQILASD